MAVKTGIEEVKRSRDHYAREIDDAERKIEQFKEQIEIYENKILVKKAVLNDLDSILEQFGKVE